MRRMKRRISILTIAGILFVAGCSHTPQSKASTGAEVYDFPPGMGVSVEASAEMTNTSTAVSQDTFSIQQMDGYSVLDGKLSDQINIHAKVLCDRDLEHPGSAAIDTAVVNLFVPADVDRFLETDAQVISDSTEAYRNAWGMLVDCRYLEYKDPNGQITDFACVSSQFSICTNLGLSFYNAIPSRIPWDSTLYPWRDQDFSFASRKEAFAMLQSYAGLFSVDLSPLCEIECITPDFFSLLERIEGSNADVPLPDMTWTEDDNTYDIRATQEWNGLPVINLPMDAVEYTMPSMGKAYYSVTSSSFEYILNAEGVQFFLANSVFSPIETGESQNLVSLDDALEVLRIHLAAAAGTEGYPYPLEGYEATVDTIMLCYLPLYKKPVNPEEAKIDSVDTSEDIPESQADLVHEMVPCWTFRVVYLNEDRSLGTVVYAVDAITGEYMPLFSERTCTE